MVEIKTKTGFIRGCLDTLIFSYKEITLKDIIYFYVNLIVLGYRTLCRTCSHSMKRPTQIKKQELSLLGLIGNYFCYFITGDAGILYAQRWYQYGSSRLNTALIKIKTWCRPRWMRPPTTRQRIAIRGVGVALVVMVTLTWVPARNVVLQPVMPGMWRAHSSWFLLKVMLTFQYFPIDSTPLGQSPISLDVDVDELMERHYEGARMYPWFYKRLSIIQRMANAGSIYAQSEVATLKQFQPAMDRRERAAALATLDVFIRACEAADLTYFLVSGSLIGAVRHHGMIPWDDDFDIIMKDSDWKKIRDVFSNIVGFELFTPSTVQWKFYLSSLPQGNRPFKWPNIDIFFYTEDEEYVWATTHNSKLSLCSKKSNVFPLSREKFELWDVPVPLYPKLLLEEEFGDIHSICAKGGYNHKTNTDSTETTFVDCRELDDLFFFASEFELDVLEKEMIRNKLYVLNITSNTYS